MSISTDMPAIRFYTGDGLSQRKGKGGINYGPRSGLCFETQYPADSPNNSFFEDCILRKGVVYDHETKYSFSILDQ